MEKASCFDGAFLGFGGLCCTDLLDQSSMRSLIAFKVVARKHASIHIVVDLVSISVSMCDMLRQQEAAKTKKMAQKQSNSDVAELSLAKKTEGESAVSAWDQYMKANSSFTSHGVFMQTVAWKVDGRRVLSVVPHPLMTDIEKVAKAVQKPLTAVHQCKLKDISTETGFPVFVCPPFGYPPDADGRPPLLLVDSSVTDLKKPLLFDCGTTGLCLTVSEFLRSTRAACVENLARAAKNPSGTASGVKISEHPSGTASPEPAPEPAPITGVMEP